MICAAMSDRTTVIKGVVPSEDVLATAACIRALGAGADIKDGECTVTPGLIASSPVLDCGESGSTLRFLLPVTSALCGGGSFTGSGRLPERPLKELVDAMKSGGAVFDREKLPLSFSGRLRAGYYSLPGNVSSQYISGLLMAFSVTPGESVLTLTSRLESSAYVDMTLDTLRLFGADIEYCENKYIVRGKERLTSPGTVTADGDWSNAAFFLVSGAIHGSVTVTGLNTDSLQGDKRIVNILRDMGADTEFCGGSLTVTAKTLRGTAVDLADIPDLLPALAVAASFAEGETRFTGGTRLRMKESDRLKTVADMISCLGGTVRELEDGLVITGTGLTGGAVDSVNDHRIVMAAAVAGANGTGPVTIKNAGAVKKSYPGFFDDFSELGGRKNVI
jgi:3-phosphoshikimate 1-carboxyvinyltransferase